MLLETPPLSGVFCATNLHLRCYDKEIAWFLAGRQMLQPIQKFNTQLTGISQKLIAKKIKVVNYRI